MINFSLLKKKIPFLDYLIHLSKDYDTEVYLVGGVLRDLFLDPTKDVFDFDFAIKSHSKKIAYSFARYIKRRVIVLDDERMSYRVVLKDKDKYYNYDFIGLRGADIREDVLNRDIVINTLAILLNSYPRQSIIDILGAKKDLSKGVIRLVSEDSVIHDPLRILRMFSLAARLGFSIDKKSLNWAKKNRSLISYVSPERINEELFKILDNLRSYRFIAKLAELEILEVIIPYLKEMRGVQQGGYHHLDVWEHSFQTLYRLELIYRRRFSKNKEITEYLNEEISSGHKRIQIIKLSALLHDIGKPFAKRKKNKKTIFYSHEKIGARLCESIADRLRLSSIEKDILKKYVFWHLRPGYLADTRKPSKRAIYRFFRDLGDEAVGVIILSLSDWRATRGEMVDYKKRIYHERVMFYLIKYYFEQKKIKPLPKLVSGYDIMNKFSLEPSPLIGVILERIREAQSLGYVKNKREALSLAAKIVKKDKKGG